MSLMIPQISEHPHDLIYLRWQYALPLIMISSSCPQSQNILIKCIFNRNCDVRTETYLLDRFTLYVKPALDFYFALTK